MPGRGQGWRKGLGLGRQAGSGRPRRFTARVPLTIVLEKEEKERWQAVAISSGRTVGDLVRTAMQQYIDNWR